MKSLIPQDCKEVQEPEPSRQAKKRVRFEDQASSVTQIFSNNEQDSNHKQDSLRKSMRIRK